MTRTCTLASSGDKQLVCNGVITRFLSERSRTRGLVGRRYMRNLLEFMKKHQFSR